jgi:hypothetical protein
MKNDNKYDALRQFISENFETTTKMHDRLHRRDIVNIAYNNKFLFSDCKVAKVFKSFNLGDHRSKCNLNRKVRSGYYYIIYKCN